MVEATAEALATASSAEPVALDCSFLQPILLITGYHTHFNIITLYFIHPPEYSSSIVKSFSLPTTLSRFSRNLCLLSDDSPSHLIICVVTVNAPVSQTIPVPEGTCTVYLRNLSIAYLPLFAFEQPLRKQEAIGLEPISASKRFHTAAILHPAEPGVKQAHSHTRTHAQGLDKSRTTYHEPILPSSSQAPAPALQKLSSLPLSSGNISIQAQQSALNIDIKRLFAALHRKTGRQSTPALIHLLLLCASNLPDSTVATTFNIE